MRPSPRFIGAVVLLASAAALAGCSAAPVSTGSTGSAETALPVAASPTPTPSPAILRVATIGDSLMAGYGLEPGQDWPSIIARHTGVEMLNASCSGAGFATIGDCGTDYQGLIPQVAAAHPDLVIIQSSDNDFWDDPDDVTRATRTTIDALRAALPDAQIVGLSTVVFAGDGWESEIGSTSAAVQTAVDAVGGTYVDLGQPLDGQIDRIQDDLEHPNIAGQHVLAKAVRHDLAEIGIEL